MNAEFQQDAWHPVSRPCQAQGPNLGPTSRVGNRAESGRFWIHPEKESRMFQMFHFFLIESYHILQKCERNFEFCVCATNCFTLSRPRGIPHIRLMAAAVIVQIQMF